MEMRGKSHSNFDTITESLVFAMLQSRHGSKKIEIISMNKLTISKICDQTL